LGVAPALWAAAAGDAKGVDLTPAMSWPSPASATDVNPGRRPVLVTIAYRIDPANRHAFLEAIMRVGRERCRDGAYAWRVFEDPDDTSRFVETFLSDSWADHLCQHERVTKADQAQENAVLQFQVGDGPQISHLVARNGAES
jgi:hypothetical protein